MSYKLELGRSLYFPEWQEAGYTQDTRRMCVCGLSIMFARLYTAADSHGAGNSQSMPIATITSVSFKQIVGCESTVVFQRWARTQGTLRRWKH